MTTLIVLLAGLIPTAANPLFPSKRMNKLCPWGMKRHRIGSLSPTLSHWHVLETLRAGATVEEVEEVEIDDDEDAIESVDDEESDDEASDDEDEEYDEESSSSDEEEYESAREEEEVSITIGEYDIQLAPPPGLQIGALLGVMLLSKRLDMYSPKVVRFARYVSLYVFCCNVVLVHSFSFLLQVHFHLLHYCPTSVFGLCSNPSKAQQ